MPLKNITVLGAGITGLLQALTLAKNGHKVTLIEKSKEPFTNAASRIAGAMLAPYCESEVREDLILDLGPKSIDLWKELIPELECKGTLVVALPRDLPELTRFEQVTTGGHVVDEAKLGELEPDLAGRYLKGLYYPDEAHMEPAVLMPQLLEKAVEAGVELCFGEDVQSEQVEGMVIDCTGMAARERLEELRGLRGEMMVIKSRDVTLNRPVRLLHPRFPIYVVPWSNNRFMIGATMIEAEDRANVRVRSALELLSTAYALHPALGEAEIEYFGADCRPSFPDNMPRITVCGDHIYVNGLHRNGFLLAPILAKQVAQYIQDGKVSSETFVFKN
ncbi:MAG: FAD-dependent oxidoreductase [Methyloligellaceae bacterium]